MIAAPLVAVLTLMAGLRIGAGEAVQTAQVFAAAPGSATPAGTPYAWQILTYLEDQGVRETIPMRDLVVVARRGASEARWTGASDEDGIAEANFTLPGDGSVAIEVLRAGAKEPLARGTVEARPRAITVGEVRARPSKRDGHPIDVFVEGERLVVGFPTPIWVQSDGVKSLHVDPEPGLLADVPLLTCDGWAEIPVTAQSHVIGLQLTTRDPDGVWFGALPVAPGSFFVGSPRWIAENTQSAAVIVAPNPRTVVYAEVDDATGRVAAAALDVKVEPGDPTPRAHWTLPAMAAGLHWLVVSGEPRGAETLGGAAIARPFLVGKTPGINESDACSVGPWLARHSVGGFPRWLAIDGMETRGANNRARHRAGMAIALIALLSAAILEVLLLLRSARETREAMARATADEDAAPAKPVGSLVVGVLVAVLGFAFLAALLIAKA